MNYGYTVAEAKTAMEGIISQYSSIGSSITKDWEQLVSVMQTEWVGADEQKYETDLAARINALYVNTYLTAKDAVTNISRLINYWLDTQASNTYSKDQLQLSVSRVSEDDYTSRLTKNDKIVNPKTVTFSESTVFGLRATNSAETIQGKVKEFVSDVRSAVDNVADTVETALKKAFPGEQQKAVLGYVQTIEAALKALPTALTDLNQALAILAGTTFTSASTSVNETYTAGATSVQSEIDSTSNKWTE